MTGSEITEHYYATLDAQRRPGPGVAGQIPLRTPPQGLTVPAANPVAVSLFDMTGNMLRPWARAGFTCYSFDWQNEDREEIVGLGRIIYRNADLTDPDAVAGIKALAPVFVSSFTPCDDLSGAGARWFAAKLGANPHCHDEALALAKVGPDLADALGVPYMVENPVGLLATLWRKPNHYFNPRDYGGYLPVDDVHPTWPDILPPRDAYNKKTCIWSGGGFIMPPPRPVAPVDKDYPGWKKLGGKSLRTKNIRSATPRGFAEAVFLYNAPGDDLA